MPVPTLSIPEFYLTVPSTKQKVKFRPYLLKEEKILLMAVESKDPEDLVLACKQVLTNCNLSNLDIEKLTTFDLEYLFLKLKAQSVNNVSNLAFIDLEDNKKYEFEVNLDEIELDVPEVDKKIQANGGTIVMKYPTMAVAASILNAKNEAEMLDNLVVGCVDYLYDEENIYNDFSREELLAWLDAQPTEVYDRMRAFFNAMPKLKHTISYTNSKGSERKIVLVGLSDFFDW